ncbi:SMP-30/gluconolactonase/LRE family protein [Paenibacillus sp. WQ 127069]|uniref:SMP-30/gluconolactonase/LRE family protein n=1 Tax=Paenibacillus baimaensis TaxID=2982185 RepID=A0ABT2U8X6_9BACL|nr:SMP-30/gluconolactonase/LRE family protein [Paenibacillus sp. WQ 127069]MCU6791090.1 SMP-30/gluconolactonase/LRE family protein [Paenibacillus sp. WQ 127069]
MNIIRYSEKLDHIISPEQTAQKLASGFSFSEGPVWCPRTNQLYFTDFPNHRIYTWNETNGLQLYSDQSDRAVGLTLDAKGRLLSCETLTRRISRTELDGSITALVTHYQGSRINNTNDVIVKKDGAIYFSDPYSTALGDTKDLDVNGVFRYDPQSGALDLLVEDFPRPNGLAFSPDESLLYIDDTTEQHVRVFEVNPDGSISNGRVFAELDTEAGPGAADGMKVDEHGNVYVTGPGGVWIFAPSGERLGRLEFPEVAANLCFGSPPESALGNTLFITASSSLYSLKLQVRGAV